MAENYDAEIEQLRSHIGENATEIVGLSGIVRALLLLSDLTDEKLRDCVKEEANNPVGRVDPDHALSFVNKLIEETAGARVTNRGFPR